MRRSHEPFPCAAGAGAPAAPAGAFAFPAPAHFGLSGFASKYAAEQEFEALFTIPLDRKTL